jgi:dihydroorotate dehydrogenase electron transfer subunit
MKPSRTPPQRNRRSREGSSGDGSTVRPPVETSAEVKRNEALNGGLRLLVLRADIPAARPGQFVMAGVPGDAAPILRRPFSLLSQDTSKKSLEILYSIEGAGTRMLSAAGPGQRLSLLGPLGKGFFAPEPGLAPHVLVAGGRGIAPLIFFANTMAGTMRRPSRPVVFLAGARTAGEIVLLDRIRTAEVFVSTDDGSAGRKGTVVELLKSLGRGPVRPVLFGCGPAAMLRALHSYAESLELDCFVSLEARMACGLGVCQGCAVSTGAARPVLVCKDGPVFGSNVIDWTHYEGA